MIGETPSTTSEWLCSQRICVPSNSLNVAVHLRLKTLAMPVMAHFALMPQGADASAI